MQLGTVALSMFARGRAVATEAALDRDLAALCGRGGGRDDEGGWARRATGASSSCTEPRPDRLPTGVRCYEFLHATFAEFLVGWLAVYAVRELVRRHDLIERSWPPPPPRTSTTTCSTR